MTLRRKWKHAGRAVGLSLAVAVLGSMLPAHHAAAGPVSAPVERVTDEAAQFVVSVLPRKGDPARGLLDARFNAAFKPLAEELGKPPAPDVNQLVVKFNQRFKEAWPDARSFAEAMKDENDVRAAAGWFRQQLRETLTEPLAAQASVSGGAMITWPEGGFWQERLPLPMLPNCGPPPLPQPPACPLQVKGIAPPGLPFELAATSDEFTWEGLGRPQRWRPLVDADGYWVVSPNPLFQVQGPNPLPLALRDQASRIWTDCAPSTPSCVGGGQPHSGAVRVRFSRGPLLHLMYDLAIGGTFDDLLQGPVTGSSLLFAWGLVNLPVLRAKYRELSQTAVSVMVNPSTRAEVTAAQEYLGLMVMASEMGRSFVDRAGNLAVAQEDLRAALDRLFPKQGDLYARLREKLTQRGLDPSIANRLQAHATFAANTERRGQGWQCPAPTRWGITPDCLRSSDLRSLMEFRDRDFSFRAGPDVPNLVRNDLRVLLWDFRAVVHEKAYEGNPEAFGALWESVKVDVYRGVFEWVLQQGFFELRLAYTRAPSLGDNEISDLVIQLMPEIIDADMLEGFMRASYPLGTPRPPSAAAAFADAMASRFIRIRNATDPL